MSGLHASETIQIFCLEILSLPAKIQIFLEKPQFQKNNFEKIVKICHLVIFHTAENAFCFAIPFSSLPLQSLRTAFLSNPYL